MVFTVEETNLIDIYRADTRAGVLENLRIVRPIYENDPELLAVVDSAARKLGAMADADFLAAAFVPAYPVEYSEDETGGFAYGKERKDDSAAFHGDAQGTAADC